MKETWSSDLENLDGQGVAEGTAPLATCAFAPRKWIYEVLPPRSQTSLSFNIYPACSLSFLLKTLSCTAACHDEVIHFRCCCPVGSG